MLYRKYKQKDIIYLECDKVKEKARSQSYLGNLIFKKLLVLNSLLIQIKTKYILRILGFISFFDSKISFIGSDSGFVRSNIGV